MPDSTPQGFFTLVQRELQEYRNSLVMTPVVIALVLCTMMLISVLLANRISAMGDAVMEVIMKDEAFTGVNVTIHIDDDTPGTNRDIRILPDDSTDDDDWDFSRDWRFQPEPRPDGEPGQKAESGRDDGLNPVLHMLHNFMLMILLLVSANYLLGCLYNDRRDRSILFWKSMPVSEVREVLSKFFVALLVAPAIFIGVSLLAQVASSLLAMLLVWRMDKDPFELVLGNIEFGRLVFNQLSGWLLTALWLAPVYAWLMLASAAARRSPFLLAIGPAIALALAEGLLLGTEHLGTAITRHFPHADESGAVGFYVGAPDWLSQDLVSIGAGLLSAAVALWIAAYLRRTRFEL
jgi:hypothetical protein